MSTMIQIRNGPADVHRILKSRAALAGMSLSDYLLNEMRTITERPTLAEVRVRLRALPAVTADIASLRVVHEGRAEHDERFDH